MDIIGRKRILAGEDTDTHKVSRYKRRRLDSKFSHTGKRPKETKSSKSKNVPNLVPSLSLGCEDSRLKENDGVVQKKPVRENDREISRKSSAMLSANWKQLEKELQLSKKTSRKKNSVHSRTRKRPDVVGQKQKCGITPDERPKQSDVDIWFDDVDKSLIQPTLASSRDGSSANRALVKDRAFSGLTKVVALDCEMVGVGESGEDSILARVSVVNQCGACVYDALVKPREKVTDFRTQYSGIKPGDLDDGKDFQMVQAEVGDILKGRILVGHAIHNDMKVLFLDHPKKQTRDTSKYKPFRKLFNGRTPSLKNLSQKLLGVEVQSGQHNSIEDAQATMRLYTMHRKVWEKELKQRKVGRKRPKIAS